MAFFGKDEQLVLLDPGLMEAGGHHAGLASSLVEYTNNWGVNSPIIVAHAHIDRNLLQQLINADFTVRPQFNVNFYDVMASFPTLSDYDAIIVKLAAEYQNAIEEVVSVRKKSIVILLPCVAWQHVMSLNLALSSIKKNHGKQSLASVRFVVCAMFNPSLSFSGNVFQISEFVNNRLAFGWLQKHRECLIAASDKELSKAYQMVLNRSEPIPIHPCYLADWGEFSKLLSSTSKCEKTVIMYTGDAKKEKGFCTLPQRIETCLKSYPDKQFIVQYTNNSDCPLLFFAEELLAEIAAKNGNVNLYNRYWQPDELLAVFAKATAISLFYSCDAYANKSSGVLWLAAYAGLDIWVEGDSWLTREAERLGSDIFILSYSNDKALLKAKQSHSNRSKEYANELYKNMWQWLATLTLEMSPKKVWNNV